MNWLNAIFVIRVWIALNVHSFKFIKFSINGKSIFISSWNPWSPSDSTSKFKSKSNVWDSLMLYKPSCSLDHDLITLSIKWSSTLNNYIGQCQLLIFWHFMMSHRVVMLTLGNKTKTWAICHEVITLDRLILYKRQCFIFFAYINIEVHVKIKWMCIDFLISKYSWIFAGVEWFHFSQIPLHVTSCNREWFNS